MQPRPLRPLRVATLGALALAACDAAPPPTTLPGAEPLACDAPARRTLRIDQLEVPLDGTAADRLGADLDHDGHPENDAGQVLASVAAIYPDLYDSVPPRVNARLAGDTVWLLDVAWCDADARVTFARGQALADGAVRVVEAGAVPAAGTVTDGHLAAEAGIGVVPLGAIADFADAGISGWAPSYPAVTALDLAADGATGTIAGGLSPGYADVIAASFLPYLQARLDAGTTEWGASLDLDGDGVISRAELADDRVFVTLMTPDLDALAGPLDPSTIPTGDGTSESMSFGFGLHAVDVVVD